MSVEGENITISNVNDPVEKKLVYPDEEVSVFNKEKLLLPENSEENKDISKIIYNFFLQNILHFIVSKKLEEVFNIDVVKNFVNRQEQIEKELDAVRMELFDVKTNSKKIRFLSII